MEKRIACAAEKYGLSQLETVSLTGDRAVVYARSDTYGPVVLKLDTDWIQLEDAFRMLDDPEGEGGCPVIACEKAYSRVSRSRSVPYGVMLAERILPGTPLREVKSYEQRLEIFCGLFRKIHRQDWCGTEYIQWLDGIVKYCQMYCVGTQLEEMAGKAYDLCVELYQKYPGVFRLHGDLHHDNILRNADGIYLYIDPKAVTGPEILDTPRFLLNELGMASEPDDVHIRRCMDILCRELGYPREDLRKAFYMETVLANIWRMEDGLDPVYEQLELAEEILH